MSSWLRDDKKFKKALKGKEKEEEMQNKAKKQWTKEVVKLLNKCWNKRNEEAIAQMLGRTVVAVRIKASKEGLLKSKSQKVKTNKEFNQIQLPLEIKKGKKISEAEKVAHIPSTVTSVVNIEPQKSVQQPKAENLKYLVIVNSVIAFFSFLGVLALIILEIL